MSAFEKVTLPNGLRIILAERSSAVTASVLILVAAGSEYESKNINGLSHFLEHMVFKGTQNRPRPGMIAEELAALGAQYNAFTSQEFTGYWAKAAAPKLPKILDIISDLYLNSLFSPEEIEKERGVIMEEINMYEDMPMRRVQDLILRLMYGDQPAGWKVDGEKEIIRSIKQKDFLAYRGKRYLPSTTVVVVAGKFNRSKVEAQLKQSFGAIRPGRALKKPKTKESQSRPKILLKFKKSDQGHLVLGFRAFDLFDRRRFAMQLLSDILGGGMSSRLFKKVREEMGAAYYIGADDDLSLDHGILEISAGVDHAKIKTVIKEILGECARMRDELVPEEELQRSKDHVTGNLLLGLETADELASFYGGQEILTGAPLSPDEIIGRINAIKATEVRAVARAIFKNSGLNLAIIGPYTTNASFSKILSL